MFFQSVLVLYIFFVCVGGCDFPSLIMQLDIGQFDLHRHACKGLTSLTLCKTAVQDSRALALELLQSCTKPAN